MLLSLETCLVFGQADHFRNPILPGFHPDPSICRVGADYYLVTASYEWHPGIPIFHSKDLVNWQQIGHALNRPSQLYINDQIGIWGGIWAPSLRYNQGTFYIITTLQPGNTTFYVTATDPAGPWSDPIIVEKAPGIDPFLFFEEDGKVWYVGSYSPEEERWRSEDRIFIQELDLPTGKLMGKRTEIVSGHAINAKSCRAPKIFKRLNKYVLLTTEGGNWNEKAVTAFVADEISGPYQALPINPVLTHRHLGKQAPITSVGHADLVETQHGSWWAVASGIRPVSGAQHFLSRETFLTPVSWQRFTPIFNPGIGKVRLEERRSNLPWSPFETQVEQDEFTTPTLPPVYNFFHSPLKKWWTIDSTNGRLKLQLQAKATTDNSDFSLVARRQESYHFEAATQFDFSPVQDYEAAGLFIGQHTQAHFRLEIIQLSGQKSVQLVKVYKNARREQKEEVVSSQPISGDNYTLGVKGKGQYFQFYVGIGDQMTAPLGEAQDGLFLSSRIAGGFTGNYVGMFASSNGRNSTNTANFDWFYYKNEDKE